jgi:hypothetical protein
VLDHLLDGTLLLKVGERLPGQRSVDLKAVDEGGNGDQLVRLDILLELVVDGLIEDNGVVGLVLDCEAKEVSSDPFLGCRELWKRWKTELHTLALGPLLLPAFLLASGGSVVEVWCCGMSGMRWVVWRCRGAGRALTASFLRLQRAPLCVD